MDYRHIERFNRIAVERELSAGAILLWQQLYCMMQRKNNFSDVKICTAVLLGFLDLTRNGFQKARKALVEACVLGIRYEGEEIYYTLELVHFSRDEKAAVDIAVNSANTVGRHDHMPPLAQRANSTNPVGSLSGSRKFMQNKQSIGNWRYPTRSSSGISAPTAKQHLIIRLVMLSATTAMRKR